jgi:hypothetical protein
MTCPSRDVTSKPLETISAISCIAHQQKLSRKYIIYLVVYVQTLTETFMYLVWLLATVRLSDQRPMAGYVPNCCYILIYLYYTAYNRPPQPETNG